MKGTQDVSVLFLTLKIIPKFIKILRQVKVLRIWHDTEGINHES